MLYDKDLNESLDSNGTEEVQAATNPSWFAGTGRELARGGSNIGTHAQRVFGQMDSSAADALGVNQSIQRDGTVGKIHDIEPTPEEDLPKFEKPDYQNSGSAAVLLGDLFEQTPTILSAIVNPAAGFAAAASMTGDKVVAEDAEKGVTGPGAKWNEFISTFADGVGGALPGVGGIGENAVLKYGSRFLLGGAINEGLSVGDRATRSSVLEAYGFTQQADQLRQWDAQSELSNFILGGAFNLAGGHAKDRGNVEAPEAPAATPGEAPAAPAPEAPPAQTAPTSTPLAGYKLSREDVKTAKSDLVNSQRHLDRLDAERAAVLAETPKGSGKTLAAGREAQRAKLADIEQQRKMSQDINDSAAQRLDSHAAYGKQRLDAMHVDAATHTVLHDNYVTESAPGLAVDGPSESAHVRAMDSAQESIAAGRPVDVSAHIGEEHTFLNSTDDNLDAGAQARESLAGRTSERANAIADAEQANPLPERTATTEAPAAEAAPSPFEALRGQLDAMRETHPELADTLAPHLASIEAEHATATAAAKQYEVAAACALNFGA